MEQSLGLIEVSTCFFHSKKSFGRSLITTVIIYFAPFYECLEHISKKTRCLFFATSDVAVFILKKQTNSYILQQSCCCYSVLFCFTRKICRDQLTTRVYHTPTPHTIVLQFYCFSSLLLVFASYKCNEFQCVTHGKGNIWTFLLDFCGIKCT